ncbi:integrase arm-type DNA-binding domain-containing protein [Aeromonas enterica]
MFNYDRPHTNKRVNISFGSYPDVTLAAVRKRRLEARALLTRAIDPQRYQQEQIAHVQAKHQVSARSVQTGRV